ncbi:unnamed protein product [Rotaria sordida]|uniref:Uncharacterized protein n=1 Tax=Rotaria sordida TaxID=392033 RepID=A0A819T0C4_9BILA|nr:unnamed protein product [Rotaria sordida]
MMKKNDSTFNTYLKRILLDLLPWIVEECSLNLLKCRKKKVIFDAFSSIYSHVWRHIRIDNNTNGDYSINRVYEVNEFIEQEAGADFAAAFRFGGPLVFTKLLLYVNTHPKYVVKDVILKEYVYKALQSKLLGILCDFETELLSNKSSQIVATHIKLLRSLRLTLQYTSELSLIVFNLLARIYSSFNYKY